MNARKLLSAAKAVEPVFIEDTFAVHLYTGNGSTQTITNGIDLAGKGGLVWTKGRSGTTYHVLTDTVRGAAFGLASNVPDADNNGSYFSGFNSTGYGINNVASINTNAATYASWTFREQAKFFDVVTYTGNGANRTIAHNLGSVPGCIIVKRTDTAGDWQVYHRANTANPETDYLVLNTTAATADSDTRWNDTLPTSTVFSLGTDATVNANTGTYVAYLFAHDAGGFGQSGSDNVISCGSFTTDGSGIATVTLNYEPQFVIVKRTDSAGNWFMQDVMRGYTADATSGTDAVLYANTSGAEVNTTAYGGPNATGFTAYYSPSATYIYIAIRRGPMKTPTTGTSVYTSASRTGTASVIPRFTSNFVVDWALRKSDVTAGGGDWQAGDRLRGGVQVKPNLTEAETAAATLYTFDSMTGYSTLGAVGSDTADRSWMFRRAPGFFDVVCYTGTGVARTVTHNLGAVPELMIVKCRNTASTFWPVYHVAQGATKYAFLNQNGAFDTANYWNNTTPTSSVFSVGALNDTGENTYTYVAYLFATCPGVSKVGSYTGTGNTLQIDCGFTGGARFVLIKRTDSTGDWYVWDSARGIVAGNDPYLLLNSTAAEVTSTDYVDTYSAGFEISSTAPAAINANGGSFIFLAIA